jgi:hypothetical protein
VQGDILVGDQGYSGLTFYDRGPGGTLIGCHNATGTSYIGLSESWMGWPVSPCKFNLSPSSTAKMPTSTLWSGNPYQPLPSLGSGATIGMARPDGINDGFDTIQGVRSYDSTSSSWTAPDANPGDVFDPTSQKSYLWNGNDPMNNVDPSGYDDYANATQPEECGAST